MQWSGLTDTTREKELATALTEARAEIERQAGAIHLLDERCAQYERRAEQAERALAVLAPVRDMLTLCGELGGMKPGETMADYLRRLIDEVAGVESLRARVREVVGPFAKAGELFGPRLSDEYDQCIYSPAAGDEYSLCGDHLRAARQLMEEVNDA